MQKSHQRQNKRLDTNRREQLLHQQTERRIFMREAINQTHNITELRSQLRTSTKAKSKCPQAQFILSQTTHNSDE
jgi:hypothetical protein